MEKLAATRAVVSEVSKTNRNSGFVKQQRRSAIGDGDDRTGNVAEPGRDQYAVSLASSGSLQQEIRMSTPSRA